MDLTFTAGAFVAKRLQLEPADNSAEATSHVIWKSAVILNKLAAFQHYYTDYTRGCSGQCSGYCKDLTAGCKLVKHRIANALVAKDALLWEVWRHGATVDFVGILRLSEVEPGCDAKAHYVFFDGKLKDKTPLLQAWKEWVFRDQPGWAGLRRITVEIPETHFALARHAQRHLGFSGAFHYRGLQVEGVKQAAKIQDGRLINMLTMGCMK